MTTRSKYRCHISNRLEHIRMTTAEREAARASLQQGVRVADAIIQLSARIRSLAGWLGRGLRSPRGRRERLTHRRSAARPS